MGSSPLYFKVKQSLVNQINKGIYKPDTYLPTEKELCDKYKVSRITIRRALEELNNDGLVIKQYSKGVKVVHSSIHQIKESLNQFKSFHEQIIEQGYEPKVYSYNWEVKKLPKEFLKNFSEIKELSDGHLLLLKRVLGTDKTPIMYLETYLTEETNIQINDYQGGSLYKLIKDVSGKTISFSKEVVRALISSKFIEEKLQVYETIPVLHRQQIGYTNEGKILFFTEAFYNSNVYKHHFVALRYNEMYYPKSENK